VPLYPTLATGTPLGSPPLLPVSSRSPLPTLSLKRPQTS
jgi:hypothetical protein